MEKYSGLKIGSKLNDADESSSSDEPPGLQDPAGDENMDELKTAPRPRKIKNDNFMSLEEMVLCNHRRRSESNIKTDFYDVSKNLNSVNLVFEGDGKLIEPDNDQKLHSVWQDEIEYDPVVLARIQSRNKKDANFDEN